MGPKESLLAGDGPVTRIGLDEDDNFVVFLDTSLVDPHDEYCFHFNGCHSILVHRKNADTLRHFLPHALISLK